MSVVTFKAQESVSVNQSTFDAISTLTTTQLLDQDVTDLFNSLSQSLRRLQELEIEVAAVLPLHSLRCDLIIWTHELAETIKAGGLHQVTREVQ